MAVARLGGECSLAVYCRELIKQTLRFWWKFLVDSPRWRLFGYSILYGIHFLKIVIRQGYDDSYLGLGITHSQPF